MFQTRGKKITPKRYQKLEFQTLKDTIAEFTLQFLTCCYFFDTM